MTSNSLLCVSCPSANEFSAILFLLLARSISNSPRSLENFRQTMLPNFIQIPQRVKNFPIEPHCKKCLLSATLQRYRKRANFTMGVYGKKIICCRINLKFCLRVCLKPFNDRGELELDRAKSKNNIVENLVALGHETHNSYR